MDELQYINLVNKVLLNGNERLDRTGVGTLSLFCEKLSFSLSDDKYPLLTTKKMFFRGIVEELLWMLKGSTNSKELDAKLVKIWNYNGSREFLDKNGFTEREEGDLGPIYGYQWRFWGAEYKDHKTNYTKKGIDQLQQVINQLKYDPFNRRIIMSAWNVSDIHKMVLPPCHCFVQFYVTPLRDKPQAHSETNDALRASEEPRGELSSCLYQRSGDIGLGVPFNIASYSLLTKIIASMVNLKPCNFHYILGDAHIYKNHIDTLKLQINRKPYDSPKLYINKKISIETLDEITFNDFKLINYKYHDSLHMNLSG